MPQSTLYWIIGIIIVVLVILIIATAVREVIFGLDSGTEIAVRNAFSLRAELSKSEAGHAH